MKTMRNVLFMDSTNSIVEKMTVIMGTVAEERAETIFKK
jgi:DNA repair protein RadC